MYHWPWLSACCAAETAQSHPGASCGPHFTLLVLSGAALILTYSIPPQLHPGLSRTLLEEKSASVLNQQGLVAREKPTRVVWPSVFQERLCIAEKQIK